MISTGNASHAKILAALEDYGRVIEEEIRDYPLHWTPCYEAVDADANEVPALSGHAVQWSVCGMLQSKMSSLPYGAETLIARRLAGRCMGLISHRIMNYENPELFTEFAADSRELLDAGGTHCNIHVVEHEIGLVGVQDTLRIFRERMPHLQQAVTGTDLAKEFSR